MYIYCSDCAHLWEAIHARSSKYICFVLNWYWKSRLISMAATFSQPFLQRVKLVSWWEAHRETGSGYIWQQTFADHLRQTAACSTHPEDLTIATENPPNMVVWSSLGKEQFSIPLSLLLPLYWTPSLICHHSLLLFSYAHCLTLCHIRNREELAHLTSSLHRWEQSDANVACGAKHGEFSYF